MMLKKVTRMIKSKKKILRVDLLLVACYLVIPSQCSCFLMIYSTTPTQPQLNSKVLKNVKTRLITMRSKPDYVEADLL